MSKEPDKETTQQLDKALTEMDVLAKDDRKIFRIDADTFRFQDFEYKLIENHRDAFDIERMEERFTDYLFKYDYIVGDIAYEKLRLRGFFDDGRKGVPIDMKISHLEDYLIEYCNFGCQYFVFERVEKNEEDPEPYFRRPKKSNRGRRGKRRTQRNKNQPNKKSASQKGKQPNKPQNKQQPKQTNKPQSKQQNKPKDFKVKKIETKPQEKTTQQPKTQEPPKAESTKPFKIRKKKD